MSDYQPSRKASRVGQTKTVGNKSYRLNENHRWELIDNDTSKNLDVTPRAGSGSTSVAKSAAPARESGNINHKYVAHQLTEKALDAANGAGYQHMEDLRKLSQSASTAEHHYDAANKHREAAIALTSESQGSNIKHRGYAVEVAHYHNQAAEAHEKAANSKPSAEPSKPAGSKKQLWQIHKHFAGQSRPTLEHVEADSYAEALDHVNKAMADGRSGFSGGGFDVKPVSQMVPHINGVPTKVINASSSTTSAAPKAEAKPEPYVPKFAPGGGMKRALGYSEQYVKEGKRADQ